MEPLANLIQSHRKTAGLSQAKLASLAGVGKTVIWDLEHGKDSVQWDTLQKVLRVLNISAEWKSPLIERAAATTTPIEDASSIEASPRSAVRPTANQ